MRSLAAIAGQREGAEQSSKGPKGRLFQKYATLLVALVVGALIANAAIESYYSFLDNKQALIAVQREKANGAAAMIEQFVKEIEGQVGWMAHSSFLPGPSGLDQRRFDSARLLRQAPAVTEVSYLDSDGREQIKVSRVAMDVVGSGADFAQDARFRDAKAKKRHLSPVHFRRETEPYLTLAIAGTGRAAGVTVAEVNLKFIWEVISRIRVGQAGVAYVVDGRGLLIAHTDIGLVLRKSDFSGLPHVTAARAVISQKAVPAAAPAISRDRSGQEVLTAFAAIDSLGWLVFVDLPLTEAFQPLYASLWRKGVVLMAGLGVAVLISLWLAQRMVVPIRALSAGAARIGGGELDYRIDLRTGDEVEAVADRFNAMCARLIQAQRMEAYGQLTGGVAHDFNNLLTIVTGNLELLASEVKDKKAQMLLRRATDAAEMGARLTSRLLTFARRRQLEPVVLNLNKQVVGMTELLHRTLGETTALTTNLDAGLWATRADPSEIENAVLNLAINARDAMPNGGRLIIGTSNVTFDGAGAPGDDSPGPGAYVRLSVTDTGMGMPPDVLKRAFEPFFTTKEIGRGTGLGLSTIYGFAHQSGGHASIYSEMGQGTTVNIYLPRAEGDAKDLFAGQSEAVPLSENDEVIMVVEDNPEVREVTLQRVEGLGYVVEEADSAPSAIQCLQCGNKVDLVFSDIVMAGGQSGYDLGRWIRANRPEIKVLLTSGFAAEMAAGGREGTDEFKVLRKPYDRGELARALKEALRG
jgi:signal transduction histidine kinase/CheY-like chemotaxis protein